MARPHDRDAQPSLPSRHLRELLADQLAQRVLPHRPLRVPLVHGMIGARDRLAVVRKNARRACVHHPFQAVRMLAAHSCDQPVDLHIVVELRPDDIRRMDHRVHTGHRALHKALIRQIARGQLDIQPVQPLQRRVVRQHRAPHLVIALQQLPHQPAAHLTGSAGDKNLHKAPSLVASGTGWRRKRSIDRCSPTTTFLPKPHSNTRPHPGTK